ncbi:MAG: enoyl-CoA hydratase-related protein [Bacteroidota bacterium]
MEYNILKPQLTDGVAVLTISRPEALNALNTRFYEELNDYLDSIEDNDSVRVLVLTGEGKAFVAGADIAEMSVKEPEAATLFSRLGQKSMARLEDLGIPVIAAVNGFALGGGCELALACDFRIASNKAKFGQPEVNLGLIPGFAATQRLPRLIGIGNALFMLMTAEMITADQALSMGLVQQVTEPENLMEVVMNHARKIAANGSFAINRIKTVTRSGINLDFEMGCDMEAQEFGDLFGEPTSKEGMKAFLEKRKPNW